MTCSRQGRIDILLAMVPGARYVTEQEADEIVTVEPESVKSRDGPMVLGLKPRSENLLPDFEFGPKKKPQSS